MTQIKKTQKNHANETLLKQVPLFKGVRAGHLSELAARCESVKVCKKKILFLEETKGKGLWILASGSVQLYKTSENGKKTTIRTVRPGEMFAEVILFEKEKYPVSAVAVQDSRLCLLPKDQFYALLDHRDFAHDFIRGLLEKNRYLVNRIAYLSTKNVEERFVGFLEDRFGREQGCFPALSKKDVAAAIGTSPESLSRLLQKYKENKTLVWEKNEIRIHAEFWS